MRLPCDQTLDLQHDALTTAGCTKIFTDTASGAQAERNPAYQPIGPLTPSAKSMQNRVWRVGDRSDAGDHAGADRRRVRAAVRPGRTVSGGVGEGPPGG